MTTPRSIGIAEETTRNSSYSIEKLLSRITTELAKGNARRAVPSWSIPRKIWLVVLRPRDPDIHETNRPIVTEG